MPKIFVNISLVLSIFLLPFIAKGQNVEKVLEVADNLYEIGDYYGSIQFYERAMEIDSTNIDVLYAYAKNLTALNRHEQSIRYYRKVSIMDRKREFPLVNYHLAEAYRYNGDYRQARRYYNRARRSFIKERDSYWYLKIKQSKDAAGWADRNESKIKAEPNNLGKMVNSSFSEYSPIFDDDKIYFSALIADSLGENQIVLDREQLSRIYVKNLSDSKNAIPLKLDAETQKKIGNFHLANPSIHENTIYFSVCDSLFNCSIWEAELNQTKLSKAKQLNKNVNDAGSNNTQPHYVVIDGQGLLFFTSDRRGGMGGLDIWMAKKEEFGFDRAVNPGDKINSAGDEITPHFSVRSRVLYFSSDWHQGFGGFDIFASKRKDGIFSERENLGMGYNSSRDDYYFFTKEGMAVFSSNRIKSNVDQNQGCCNDLYEASFREEEIVEEEKQVTVAILNKLLPLNLYFHNDEPNPGSRSETTERNYLDLAEEYLGRKEEYFEQFEKKSQLDQAIEVEDFFDTEINQGIEELKEFTPLLLQELKKGSQIELSIRGFASALSKSDYNLKLANRRIESLINYFKSYDRGALLPYLNQTAQDGGQLKIRKLPFGDYAIREKKEKSQLEAIYGIEAVKQRKIELVAVSNSFDSSRINVEGLAVLDLKKTVFELNSIPQNEVVTLHLPIENKGDAVLEIYNIIDNCNCIEAKFMEKVKPGERSDIVLKITSSSFKRDESHEIEASIISNAAENLIPLKIKFRVE